MSKDRQVVQQQLGAIGTDVKGFQEVAKEHGESCGRIAELTLQLLESRKRHSDKLSSALKGIEESLDRMGEISENTVSAIDDYFERQKSSSVND